MIRYYLFLSAALLIAGCKTNPPTDPNAINLNSGEIAVRIKFVQDSSLSPDKKVLLEDFANVSCVPCVTSNQIIEKLTRVSYGPQKLISIKFPTNFPSPNDPFYLANKEACNSRMNFYKILQAPTIIIDGLSKPTFSDSNSYKQAINSRLTLQSKFSIEVTKTEQSGGLIFNLSIKVKDSSTIDFSNLYLHFIVAESEIEFANPPGSNGEIKFFDVMRLTLPSNDGFLLSEVKSYTGLGKTFIFSNTINSAWGFEKLNAVVFIQNKTTKEVLQAGSTYNN